MDHPRASEMNRDIPGTFGGTTTGTPGHPGHGSLDPVACPASPLVRGFSSPEYPPRDPEHNISEEPSEKYRDECGERDILPASLKRLVVGSPRVSHAWIRPH